MKKDKLEGINEICAYTGKTAATLINWKRDYDFPMMKNDEAIFISSKEDIANWYRERGVNPKNVSEKRLYEFWESQQSKFGKKFFNYKLKNINEISTFVNLSHATLLNYYRNYEGCPIERDKDGAHTVDADVFYFWLKKKLGLRPNITYLEGMGRQ